jgi:cobalt-zinc-cadmium efflux system protein
VAGALIWAFGWRIADPIASVVIAGLVLYASWSLLRETVDVLLEAAPAHLDVDDVRRALLGAEGVATVHDLHVWTITSGMVSLSCHVLLAPDAGDQQVLPSLQTLLRERFDIHHVTIQVEPEGMEDHEVC